MTIYKAPDFTPFNIRPNSPTVFLAGSIEMGKAVNWQARAGQIFDAAGFIVLDPRRDDWDSSWEQSIENDQFEQQVRWELTGLEEAYCVLMNFDPDTKSPISLLELGMLSQLKPKKTFVACPKGFWRHGNVEIICYRYKIPLFDSLDVTIGACIKSLRKFELAKHG